MSQARITCSDHVAHVLKLVGQRLEVEDKVDSSQLFVLAHEHLCFQHPVEIRNVDEVEVGGHVSFISGKHPRSKTIVRKTSH